MKKKKLWPAVLLAASLTVSAGAVSVYAATPQNCYYFCDEDGDGICDSCGRDRSWDCHRDECQVQEHCHRSGGHHGGSHGCHSGFRGGRR